MTIKPFEELCDLPLLGIRVIQRKDGFRFGTDAVLLADFARIARGERVADLGTGAGIIPILISIRKPSHHCVGIELDADMADMAARSAELNGLKGSVEIMNGDIRTIHERLGTERFDVVTCNPPYQRKGTGIESPSRLRSAAKSETFCTFEDVAKAAFRLLRNRGRVYIIIRASRLSEAMTTLSLARLEPKELRLVQKSAGSPPTLALICAVKHGGKDIRVLPPLITHDGGEYTREMREIYSGGRDDVKIGTGSDSAG